MYPFYESGLMKGTQLAPECMFACTLIQGEFSPLESTVAKAEATTVNAHVSLVKAGTHGRNDF